MSDGNANVIHKDNLTLRWCARNCWRTDAFMNWTADAFKYKCIHVLMSSYSLRTVEHQLHLRTDVRLYLSTDVQHLPTDVRMHLCPVVSKNEYKSNYCWRADGRKKLAILTVRGRVNERLRVRSKPYQRPASCQAGRRFENMNAQLPPYAFLYNGWGIHDWRYFCTI